MQIATDTAISTNSHFTNYITAVRGRRLVVRSGVEGEGVQRSVRKGIYNFLSFDLTKFNWYVDGGLINMATVW